MYRKPGRPAGVFCFSVLGQKIQSGVFRKGEQSIDLKNLIKGTYVIQIRTDRQTFTEKIIKR
ncbi:T9SS type A sorting domain-containing protein [Chryseobacterium arthrosphaerae]|uniref:T9SS type A sorting domain-containing protein n=1 Tax=Chryseobacterium arthrosphaerae TaxID=651561 RepID=A0A3S0Q8N7_9FLAO|nr:T9SS type A sorting domain-containing protein [Chryseobacterium arthrosphaerae]